MNPQVTLETITPQTAQQMLAHNDNNRGISLQHVNWLARQMKERRWKQNGATICLNGDRLIDGQHRLMAIIKANVTVQILVVRQIDAGAFDTVDTGRRRSPADVLGIVGHKNVYTLAGAMRLVELYYAQKFPNSAQHNSNAEVLELVQRYPDITESANWAAGIKACKLLTPSYWAAVHYILSQLSAQEAQEFLTGLVTGANIELGSPVQVLRKRLEDNLGAKTKYPKPYLLAFVIKAWNSHRQGKPCVRLLYKFDSQYQEEFPVAI